MKRVYRGMAISRYWRLRLKPWQLRVWITVALILKWAGCTQFRDQPLAGIYRPRINASPRASANTPPGYIYDANIAPTARKLFHHLVEDSLQWDSCWMDGKPRVLFRIVCLCVSFPFFFFFFSNRTSDWKCWFAAWKAKTRGFFWCRLRMFDRVWTRVSSRHERANRGGKFWYSYRCNCNRWWMVSLKVWRGLWTRILVKKKKKSGGSRSNWNNFAD